MTTESNSPLLQSLSPEETNRLIGAMKDPKFATMFADYMKEVSDPEARKQNELYLQQLEQEQSLPEGMQLLKPSPLFCMKVRHTDNGKLFVNVCTSNMIDRPVSVKCDQGVNWNFPYSCSNARTTTLPKNNTSALVVDVTFHSDILKMNDSRVRQLIESSALEGAEKVAGKIFGRPYRVLSKVKCKDGPPAILRIGGTDLHDWKMPSSVPTQDPQPDYSQIKNETDDIELHGVNAVAVAEVKPAPKYEIIHRGQFRMQDCTVNTGFLETVRPQALVVKIYLPDVDSLSNWTDVVLDAHQDQMMFEIKGLYLPLIIKLPYPVDQEGGVAKFNSSNRILSVIFQVLQNEPVSRSQTSC